MRFLIVGLGGFAGAIARYAISSSVENCWRRGFPLATFLINVTGCFVIGFFLTYASARLLHPNWRLLIATGFVGAYTTFSTFEYETFRLREAQQPLIALGYVMASLIAGYLAVMLAVSMARR
jgi:CrcB protein